MPAGTIDIASQRLLTIAAWNAHVTVRTPRRAPPAPASELRRLPCVRFCQGPERPSEGTLPGFCTCELPAASSVSLPEASRLCGGAARDRYAASGVRPRSFHVFHKGEAPCSRVRRWKVARPERMTPRLTSFSEASHDRTRADSGARPPAPGGGQTCPRRPGVPRSCPIRNTWRPTCTRPDRVLNCGLTFSHYEFTSGIPLIG